MEDLTCKCCGASWVLPWYEVPGYGDFCAGDCNFPLCRVCSKCQEHCECDEEFEKNKNIGLLN